MFDDHTTLDQALEDTGIWHAIHTALRRSTPTLASYTDTPDDPPAIHFQDCTGPRTGLTGRIRISPTTGTLTLDVTNAPSRRWFAALGRIATVTQDDAAPDTTRPVWTWQPGSPDHPGTLTAATSPGPGLSARTTTTNSNTTEPDRAKATLTLTPIDRDACPAAWRLGIAALGTLATGDPHYPAPTDQPATNTTAPDGIIRLDADAAITHATDQTTGPAPTAPTLIPAWQAWRATVYDHLLNGCRAVGTDPTDAIRGAQQATGYQRRTPGPLSDEVDALTEAGAHWHHTPYGVFWTDPDTEQPPTDYPTAIRTAQEALALLDDNPETAPRDTDPAWPAATERAAVLALRAHRDALTAAHQATAADRQGGSCHARRHYAIPEHHTP